MKKAILLLGILAIFIVGCGTEEPQVVDNIDELDLPPIPPPPVGIEESPNAPNEISDDDLEELDDTMSEEDAELGDVI